MRVRVGVPTAIVLSLLALGTCGEPEVEAGLDAEAKLHLASLPGLIGIKLQAGERRLQFKIERGELTFVETLPPPPDEALETFIDSSGAERGLPRQERFEYGDDQLTSPDGTRVSVVIGYHAPYPQVPAFVVLDTTAKAIVAEVADEPHRSIREFAWSPDSQMLAVLELTSEGRFVPRNLLSGCAGHPVRYQTFYLVIYDRAGKLITSAKIAEGLPNAGSQISWTN